MNIEQKIENADWLFDKDVQKILSILSDGGEEARIVGGAVRNHLLLKPIMDIDIATTCLPQETVKRAKVAGFEAVPTGIDYGTITIIAGGCSYEVTTLRADIETDGRHAKVLFGRDWKKDAERRDFTINALYLDATGRIYDDVGGLKDMESQTLRFIGDASERICEDYLRILRFFRFFAWYGKGRPDTEGLKACVRLKDGLNKLSSERVWAEMKKILSAPDPARALLWMRQSGVLTVVLPESEKWGIDAIHALVETGNAMGWGIDPLLRLESIVPPDIARIDAMAKRLRFSNHEKARLKDWVNVGRIQKYCSDLLLKKQIYIYGRQGILDQLALELSNARARAVSDDQALLDAGHYARLRDLAESFEIPVLPVRGKDLIDKGYEKGSILGEALKKMESLWIDSGFKIDKQSLLESLEQGQ